jgi:hypothetical protein
MGCARLTQRTDDGTLLIHIERKQPSDMIPSSTFSGRLPKGLRRRLAIMLLSLNFSSTAPMEKPAMKSRTVGSKNWPQISLAASGDASGTNRACLHCTSVAAHSADAGRRACVATVRIGMSSDVT